MSVATKQKVDLPEQVASLLLQMKAVVLLLPNVVVAEIVGISNIEKIAEKPEWYLGHIKWRDINIPLVSYEGINELAIADINNASRIVIVNGIGGNSSLPFYGLVCQGIPRLTRVFPREMSQEERSSHLADHINLSVNGEAVILPALERIEKTIISAL